MNVKGMCALEVNALKDWLLSYRDISKEIDSQLARLQLMEDRMHSLGAMNINDMPKAPSPEQDKLGIMVSNYIDLQNEIKEDIELHKEQKKEIEHLIKGLRRSEERAVIRARYIDSLSWNDINNLLFGEEIDYVEKEESYMRVVFRSHKIALESMASSCNESSLRTLCLA